MYKTIIILMLVLGMLGMGFLFARSCSNNREYRERIEKLGTEIDKYSDINKQLSQQNREFEASIGRLEQQLNDYRERIAEAKRITSELSTDTSRISGELRIAIAQVQRIRESVKKLKEQLNFK